MIAMRIAPPRQEHEIGVECPDNRFKLEQSGLPLPRHRRGHIGIGKSEKASPMRADAEPLKRVNCFLFAACGQTRPRPVARAPMRGSAVGDKYGVERCAARRKKSYQASAAEGFIVRMGRDDQNPPGIEIARIQTAATFTH